MQSAIIHAAGLIEFQRYLREAGHKLIRAKPIWKDGDDHYVMTYV